MSIISKVGAWRANNANVHHLLENSRSGLGLKKKKQTEIRCALKCVHGIAKAIRFTCKEKKKVAIVKPKTQSNCCERSPLWRPTAELGIYNDQVIYEDINVKQWIGVEHEKMPPDNVLPSNTTIAYSHQLSKGNVEKTDNNKNNNAEEQYCLFCCLHWCASIWLFGW